MFGRQVTMKLKDGGAAAEFNRITKSEILPLLRCYQNSFIAETLLLDGTSTVKTFDFARLTVQQATAARLS
jgi:hypothetical protein